MHLQKWDYRGERGKLLQELFPFPAPLSPVVLHWLPDCISLALARPGVHTLSWLAARRAGPHVDVWRRGQLGLGRVGVLCRAVGAMAKQVVGLGTVAFIVCHCLLEPRVWRIALVLDFLHFLFPIKGKNQRGGPGDSGSDAPSLVGGKGACEPVTKTSLQLEETLGKKV